MICGLLEQNKQEYALKQFLCDCCFVEKGYLIFFSPNQVIFVYLQGLEGHTNDFFLKHEEPVVKSPSTSHVIRQGD